MRHVTCNGLDGLLASSVFCQFRDAVMPQIMKPQARALPVASRAEAGKVKLIRGNWLSDSDEATSFPHGAHDDQVDAVSGAVQMLTKPRRMILYA